MRETTATRETGASDRGRRWLAVGLLALAALLTANSLLGPLALGVIDYHYGVSMTNQGIGLDAVALALAVPLAVAAAALAWRGHPAGSALAFAPASFAAYMAPQYVVGPEYLNLPGNNERAFPLHLAMLIVGIGVFVAAWAGVDPSRTRPDSRRSDRRRSWALVAIAVFIGVGRWLPSVAAVLVGDPPVEYRDNATAFWLVAVLDLGVVVPGLAATAIGLRGGATWARTASYACIGWFSLVPASVAAMSIVMVVNHDPLAAPGAAVLFSVVGLILTSAAAMWYLPLFRRAAPAAASSSSG